MALPHDQLLEVLLADLADIARRQRDALEVLADVVVPDDLAAARAELGQLVDQLVMHVARVRPLITAQAPRTRPINLHRLIHEVVAATSLGEHELILGFADPPVFVIAERPRLEVALGSLLANAAEAMPARGTIMIAIHAVDRVRVEISDSGPGIPAEVVTRMFEPFFTTKDPTLHDGLGLTFAQAAVRSWGGEIVATSQPDVGATFVFDLPRAGDE